MVHHSALDKVRGKIKEAVGELTGNERMRSEGRTDQAKAKVRAGVEKFRDSAAGMRDSLKRHTGRHY
ncbi:CsbD family protein [Streptomyces sp. NPDC053493]|uniref:CsbD family protein n=1 Tax=Streptomyces sp. NPDC053493 TaxID=3365705 RepID=UPI0037CEC555